MTVDHLSEPIVRAHVNRHFVAAPEVIFDAWLSSKSIANWMFGPAVRDEEIVSILLDGKVGGAFSFVVIRDGRRLDHLGRYLEIDRPNRLVFTWGVKQGGGDNSRVVVEVVPRGDGCELTLTHEMPSQWAEYVGRVEESWAKMLEALATTLA